MLVRISPVLTLLTQAEIEMPKNPSKNRSNLCHRKTLRSVSFFQINSGFGRFVYLTNAISWPNREWLKHCTLVGSKAGVCVLEPAFGKVFIGIDEVVFGVVCGKMVDADGSLL